MNENPDAKARHFIYNADLFRVEERLATAGFNKTKIHDHITLYRDYLFLRWKFNDLDLPPSRSIDIVWQYHILDTEHYRDFCDALFGAYLDRPANLPFKSDSFKKRFEHTTAKCYHEVFHKHMPRLTNWRTKVRQFFWNKERKWISMAIVSPLIALLVMNYNYVEENYEEMFNSVRMLSMSEENIYLLCNSGLEETQHYFFLLELSQITRERNKHFADFVNALNNLEDENLLTEKANAKAKQYAAETNTIYLNSYNVCKTQLRPPKKIYEARKSVTKILKESKEHFIRLIWLPK